MSILSWTTDVAGQINVNPRRLKIISTDSLAVVTAAGYLNTIKAEGFAIYPTDIVDMIYLYNQSTNSGTYGEFLVSIAGGTGLITLALNVDAGNVLLPVVSGDVAIFNGTTGQISDSGVLGSNIVSKAAINTMAAGGEIILDKATATTTAGAATINKQSGVLTTPALTTASGAAYTITLTNSEIAATSIVQCQIQGGTNTTPGITTIATPGAGSAVILVENSGIAAAALNGTVILSFVVL